MKNKFLILFIGIISFLGISEVRAETFTINNISFSQFPSQSLEQAKNDYINNSSVISTMYSELYEYYVENYKDLYPYYSVSIFMNGSNVEFYISAFSDIPQISRISVNSNVDFYLTDFNFNINPNGVFLTYFYTNGTYRKPFGVSTQSGVASNYLNDYFSEYNNRIAPYVLFYSNFELKYVSENSSDKIIVNNWPFTNSSLTINSGDSLPKGQDLYELDIISDPNLSSSNYTEINLNNYPYVALALKNYSNTDEFVTTMYVKGQYCLSPVYNYGMTERKDILSGTTIQRCSLVYDNFTPIRTYILENDIKNNAIYYLKAYDTTHDNIVRVDSSIFDITYITEETEDNPYIMVGGKSYPAIAYDDLTDSATISEENNYVSGASCALGDMNCVSTITGQSFTFSDIFTSPLEILKDVWSAIVKVFELITMLISLLPPVLQAFLYMSFMLAIILGLIKILL